MTQHFFGVGKFAFPAQCRSERSLAEQGVRILRAKNSGSRIEGFLKERLRGAVKAQRLVNASDGHHQPRLDFGLRAQARFDLFGAFVQNFTRGDGIAAGFAGIGHLEQTRQKIQSAGCGRRFAIGAVAFARDANRLDHHGHGQNDEHDCHSGRADHCNAMPADEFLRAVGGRRRRGQNRLVVQVALDIGGQRVGRIIAA